MECLSTEIFCMECLSTEIFFKECLSTEILLWRMLIHVAYNLHLPYMWYFVYIYDTLFLYIYIRGCLLNYLYYFFV